MTARAVQSVLDRFEGPVILVHNGSELENIKKLQLEFSPKRAPSLEHLILPINRGYSGGVNAGLARAFERGALWTALITNDCSLYSYCVPEPSSVPALWAPRIEIRNTGRVDSIGGFFYPHRAKLIHCRSLERWTEGIPKALRYVPGTAFVVHRKIWERVGGMNELLGTYWEDVQWSQEVQNAGFPILAETRWILRHQIGKTCHKDSHYSVYLFHRNRRRVSWKYSNHRGRVVLVGFLVFLYLKTSIRLLQKKRWIDVGKLIKSIT